MNKILIVSVIVLFATGCSREPSKKAAHEAVSNMLKNSFMGGGTTIEGFDIHGCTKAAGADGVVCDATGTLVLNEMGRSANIPLNARFRFSKASGDWVAHPM